MAQPAPRARGGAPGGHRRPGWTGVAAGALMCSAGLFALADYQRVTTIYAPPPDAPPLGERIVDAQFNSPLFAHQADYAAATNMRSPAAQALAFDRAPHILLDTRLMMAWARFLAETGERDKARWLAARLREFNHPDAAAFFARCAGPGSAAGPSAAASAAGAVPSAAAPAVSTAKAGAERAGRSGPSSAGAKAAASHGGGAGAAGAAGGAFGGFQCEPPERSYRWRDFAQAVDWDRLSRLANPGQAPAAASAPGRP